MAYVSSRHSHHVLVGDLLEKCLVRLFEQRKGEQITFLVHFLLATILSEELDCHMIFITLANKIIGMSVLKQLNMARS